VCIFWTTYLSKEDDLRNEGRVGHHHGDWSEHALEIVRQLSTACIPWVHGDEQPCGPEEADLCAFKDEATRDILRAEGRLRGEDRQDLLRNDREHLNVDTIELVEASPCSCLSKTTEHTTKRLEVESLATVHDDDVVTKRLAEILDCLGLTGTRRTLHDEHKDKNDRCECCTKKDDQFKLKERQRNNIMKSSERKRKREREREREKEREKERANGFNGFCILFSHIE
jgi:hypothetical protein